MDRSFWLVVLIELCVCILIGTTTIVGLETIGGDLGALTGLVIGGLVGLLLGGYAMTRVSG